MEIRSKAFPASLSCLILSLSSNNSSRSPSTALKLYINTNFYGVEISRLVQPVHVSHDAQLAAVTVLYIYTGRRECFSCYNALALLIFNELCTEIFAMTFGRTDKNKKRNEISFEYLFNHIFKNAHIYNNYSPKWSE